MEAAPLAIVIIALQPLGSQLGTARDALVRIIIMKTVGGRPEAVIFS